MLDDAQLLRQVLTTEDPARWRAAWRAFVSRYQRLIAHRVRFVLRSGDIDDTIGDVWLALMERNMARLRSYNPERGTVSSFIAMIATRIAIDHLRRQRITVELDGEHPALECSDGVEASARAILVQRAMERLSDRERDFVLRLIYEEQPAEKVAADLGISLSTVYTRRHKLQKKLAQMIEEMA